MACAGMRICVYGCSLEIFGGLYCLLVVAMEVQMGKWYKYWLGKRVCN